MHSSRRIRLFVLQTNQFLFISEEPHFCCETYIKANKQKEEFGNNDCSKKKSSLFFSVIVPMRNEAKLFKTPSLACRENERALLPQWVVLKQHRIKE